MNKFISSPTLKLFLSELIAPFVLLLLTVIFLWDVLVNLQPNEILFGLDTHSFFYNFEYFKRNMAVNGHVPLLESLYL